jgi:hypothetical protein
MPKAAIELAMTSELHKLENLGHGGVCVPKRGSQACCFSTRTKPGTVWFSFEDLINVVNFALHNTLLTDLDGNLWRQRDGVPMGDPHSPGITITTCAWMEDEWLTTVAPAARQHFQTKRFMDDLLTVFTDGYGIDTAQLLGDQCQQCYWPPLTLEDGHQGTFLETSFEIDNNTFRFWLKNDNVAGEAAPTCVALRTFQQFKQLCTEACHAPRLCT